MKDLSRRQLVEEGVDVADFDAAAWRTGQERFSA